MSMKSLKNRTVIFREGDISDSMYYIAGLNDAKVGIYSSYGTSNEVKLTTIGVDSFFGEMAMINDEKRSATAVALTDVMLIEIKKEDFHDYFSKKPDMMLELLKQSSKNLRRLTNDYVDACITVNEYMAVKNTGGQMSEELAGKLKKYAK